MARKIQEHELDQAFGEGMSEATVQAKRVARDVIDLIKAGDFEEAILRLEREFWPKWASVGQSQMELQLLNHANKEAAKAVSDPCPDCGKQLASAIGGGVKCTAPKCNYWFCF